MNNSRPVLNPNLPENEVKVVAVGELYLPLIEDSFRRFGISVLSISTTTRVCKAIGSHVDITTHHLGENKIIASPDTYIKTKWQMDEMNKKLNIGDWDIIPGCETLDPIYPGDILLNALRIGKYLFCNVTHTDVRLLEHYEKNGIEIVSVKQGYAKCSVCVVQSNAAITSDTNLADAMTARGFDVLKITPGYIDLPGFDYGFIGGATGKIAPDIMCFTGSLKEHPDRESINGFLRVHGVRPVELTERTCFDIGSIIPLVEKI